MDLLKVAGLYWVGRFGFIHTVKTVISGLFRIIGALFIVAAIILSSLFLFGPEVFLSLLGLFFIIWAVFVWVNWVIRLLSP